MVIDFNRPFYTGNEMEYMKKAMETNKISGDGIYTKKVNKYIQDEFGAKKALLVTSGSSALDMAALLIDLKPGDEVIMPSYTFVSTANAVALRGAKVVFADVDKKTMNIDPQDIEKKITSKTKAIFPVHYAGVACDMDKIMKIARKYNLKVVEDAAQAVDSKYKNKYLGTIGDIGCYSFHETKNVVCGEGGALLINDPKLFERAEIIREKGTNRSKFYRGEVDKYSWVDIGSSYLPSDILAAFLYAQFEKKDLIKSLRAKIFNYYYDNLKPLQEKGLIQLPFVPEDCDINYHMFYIILETEEKRNYVMRELKKLGIQAVFHYVPLHTSEVGLKIGCKKGDLPITEEYSARLLRLPMFADLTQNEQKYIIDKLKKLLM